MSTFHLPSILSESKGKDIRRRRCWFQSDQSQVILRSILCSVQMSWEELRCILRLRFWYGRFGKTSDDTVLLKSVPPMQRSATLLQSLSCDCESNGCWPHIWKLQDESNNENYRVLIKDEFCCHHDLVERASSFLSFTDKVFGRVSQTTTWDTVDVWRDTVDGSEIPIPNHLGYVKTIAIMG